MFLILQSVFTVYSEVCLPDAHFSFTKSTNQYKLHINGRLILMKIVQLSHLLLHYHATSQV